ncbi:unnamed protein product, partial [marine sediment metagenome]
GMDWQSLLDKTVLLPSAYVEREVIKQTNIIPSETEISRYRYQMQTYSNISVGELLKIIQDTDIGKIISVPRIVTTNNKMGMILDGSRITYVTRYSSYANIYETQEMTAGGFKSITVGFSTIKKSFIISTLVVRENKKGNIVPRIGTLLVCLLVSVFLKPPSKNSSPSFTITVF